MTPTKDDRRRKPFMPDDLRRIAFVSDPMVHPDGKRIAYVLKRVDKDREKNRYRGEIRLTDSRGRAHRVLTGPAADCDTPLWSPDGRFMLFLTRRVGQKKARVCVIRAEGGGVRNLTRPKEGLASPAWSPDGKAIAFLEPVDPGAEEGAKRGREAPFAEDVEVITRAHWRLNAKGSFVRKRPHLFIVPGRGGEPIQLTKGHFNVVSFAFTVDGQSILYIATPDPTDDWASATRADIHMVRLDGKGQRKITDFPGAFSAVRQSPTGEILAIGNDHARSWASPDRLWLVDLKAGRSEVALPELDFSTGDGISSDVRFPTTPYDPWISPDGRMARVRLTQGPCVRLAEVDLAKKTLKTLTPPDASVLGWHSSPDGRLRVEIRTGMTRLPELWAVVEGDQPRQITHYNDRLLAARKVFPAQALPFTASDGARVDAWLIRPAPRRLQRTPMVLAIHGGPKTTYGHSFMLEFQMLAGMGIAVLFSNPRGSDGYGTEWAYAVLGHYGERDYLDLMQCVDHALEHDRGLDPRRLGVCGGSYGGFMTNWIVGHTDRFKAAVSSRGISNWVSMFGTSDIGYYFSVDHVGGTPWADASKYREKSPLTYVENVRTPILLTHGEQDLRCPIEQAEQFFIALRRLGRMARLARFPEENHELSRSGKPNRRMERLRLIREWFHEML